MDGYSKGLFQPIPSVDSEIFQNCNQNLNFLIRYIHLIEIDNLNEEVIGFFKESLNKVNIGFAD